MDTSSPAYQLVGAVLNGRWKLVRLLGEGGMGAVYEADGVRGEGKRAIKVLHAEFQREDVILQRFFTEAQACRGLQHPNIAQTYEHATAEDGSPYLVMELLQGIPLNAYMDRGSAIAPQQAAPIIHQVLLALQAAHGQRIVHRDLKPDNLFLVRDPRGTYVVKILDFGIAKVMDAAGGMGSKTRTGMLLGTPGYMSPEQIKNSKGVDPRSDLWSVGVIFYEMLTAAPPFVADSEFARLTAVLTDPVKPIEQVAPQLASWAGFFQRALAKNPAERFQTADEMARAVIATARGAPAAATLTAPPSEWRAVSISQPPPPIAGPGGAGSTHHSPAGGPSTLGSPQQTVGAGPGPQSMQQQFQQPMHGPIPSPMAGSAGSANPTHVSGHRPVGTPTMNSNIPAVSVIDAPPMHRGAAWWMVGAVGAVCLVIGFVVGFLVGG
jgi:serine/threonine-protein kinase